MRFYVGGVFRQNIDNVLKAFALSAGITHGEIIGRSTDDVKKIRRPGCFGESVDPSRRPLFSVTPPMCCLDIVWMIVSPCPAHTLGVLMVWNNVVVVSELYVANRAYTTLLPDLAVQQLPHLGRRS
jgi:hypothetical protein